MLIFVPYFFYYRGGGGSDYPYTEVIYMMYIVGGVLGSISIAKRVDAN